MGAAAASVIGSPDVAPSTGGAVESWPEAPDSAVGIDASPVDGIGIDGTGVDASPVDALTESAGPWDWHEALKPSDTVRKTALDRNCFRDEPLLPRHARHPPTFANRRLMASPVQS